MSPNVGEAIVGLDGGSLGIVIGSQIDMQRGDQTERSDPEPRIDWTRELTPEDVGICILMTWATVLGLAATRQLHVLCGRFMAGSITVVEGKAAGTTANNSSCGWWMRRGLQPQREEHKMAAPRTL